MHTYIYDIHVSYGHQSNLKFVDILKQPSKANHSPFTTKETLSIQHSMPPLYTSGGVHVRGHLVHHQPRYIFNQLMVGIIGVHLKY